LIASLPGRILKAGYAFISPDYRLLPDGGTTAHEILEDVKDVFAFLASKNNYLHISLPSLYPAHSHSNPESGTSSTETLKIKIDESNLSVAGASAGGLCAYLAAMHVQLPAGRLKAVLSLYGMGGNFLVSISFLLLERNDYCNHVIDYRRHTTSSPRLNHSSEEENF
jgi:acetyl esterase/lipase